MILTNIKDWVHESLGLHNKEIERLTFKILSQLELLAKQAEGAYDNYLDSDSEQYNILDILGLLYGSKHIWVKSQQKYQLDFPIMCEMYPWTGAQKVHFKILNGYASVTLKGFKYDCSIKTPEYTISTLNKELKQPLMQKNPNQKITSKKVTHHLEDTLISIDKAFRFYKSLDDILSNDLSEATLKEFIEENKENKEIFYIVLISACDPIQQLLINELNNQGMPLFREDFIEFFSEFNKNRIHEHITKEEDKGIKEVLRMEKDFIQNQGNCCFLSKHLFYNTLEKDIIEKEPQIIKRNKI